MADETDELSDKCRPGNLKEHEQSYVVCWTTVIILGVQLLGALLGMVLGMKKKKKKAKSDGEEKEQDGGGIINLLFGGDDDDEEDSPKKSKGKTKTPFGLIITVLALLTAIFFLLKSKEHVDECKTEYSEIEKDSTDDKIRKQLCEDIVEKEKSTSDNYLVITLSVSIYRSDKICNTPTHFIYISTIGRL